MHGCAERRVPNGPEQASPRATQVRLWEKKSSFDQTEKKKNPLPRTVQLNSKEYLRERKGGGEHTRKFAGSTQGVPRPPRPPLTPPCLPTQFFPTQPCKDGGRRERGRGYLPCLAPQGPLFPSLLKPHLPPTYGGFPSIGQRRGPRPSCRGPGFGDDAAEFSTSSCPSEPCCSGELHSLLPRGLSPTMGEHEVIPPSRGWGGKYTHQKRSSRVHRTVWYI